VNIKMRYLAAVVAGMLMITNTAASDEPRYMTGAPRYMTGAGIASCGKFIADTEDDETFGNVYFFWAQGFLSGLNIKYLLNMESATDFLDHEAMKLWIENYCKENPLDNYSVAAMKLWHELRVRQGLNPDPLINPEN